MSYHVTSRHVTPPLLQPQTNVTKSAQRTPQPTTKSWAKPEAVSIPLSQIQQDEAKMKKSSPTVSNRSCWRAPPRVSLGS